MKSIVDRDHRLDQLASAEASSSASVRAFRSVIRLVVNAFP